MIQLGGRTFELAYENKNGWNFEAFRDRYSDVLDRYDYIVGDWGYNQLRLKGFFREENPKCSKESSITTLQEYIQEYCNFGCAYFVLERIQGKKKIVDLNLGDTEHPKEELPRRHHHRDVANHGDRDNTAGQGSHKGAKEQREPKESKEQRERKSRDPKESQPAREQSGARTPKQPKATAPTREREPKDAREGKESTEQPKGQAERKKHHRADHHKKDRNKANRNHNHNQTRNA